MDHLTEPYLRIYDGKSVLNLGTPKQLGKKVLIECGGWELNRGFKSTIREMEQRFHISLGDQLGNSREIGFRTHG